MNTNSIGFKLVSRGLLAVLIPLAVTGYMAIRNSSKAITELAQATAQDTAVSVADAITYVMAGEKQSAQILASNELIHAVTKVVNQKGIESSATVIAPLRQKMKEDYQIIKGKYLGVFVTNAEGIIYTGELASGKEYKGSNISKRACFQKAKSSSQPVVGNVVRSKSTGKLISFVCAPIVSESGQFQGVVGMSMKASVLTDLVTSRKVGKTGYAFMANSEGIINAHPVTKYVLELDLKTLKGMEEITNSMVAGKTGVRQYHFKGTDKIAGFAPVVDTGWSVALTQNQKEFLNSVTAQRNATIIIALISLIIVAFLIVLVSRGITKPINSAVEGLKDIAQGEGDLTMRLKVTSKDEIGELATWFNTFIEKLQGIIGQINDNTKLVDSSSGKLNTIAQELTTSAGDTSGRADNVAAAAEEMNVNMTNVAAAMEESTINTSMVASAAEEMTATISEIAKNAEDAHSISSAAVHQANSTSEKMSELGQAAQAISKVTETITEISEQTNLLALNATIEAARAGEAGKGFAVVANEIKELAKQTAEATMNIKTQIEGVQGTTNATVDEIAQISTVINNINEIVGTISTAVVEQSSATQEIADNISQASMGLGEVNENVNQSSAVSSSITQDINEVNLAAGTIADSSEQLSNQANELQHLSQDLTNIIGKFKI